MTILFDSQIYPDNLVADYTAKSKVVLDYAAHNLCTAIYQGLIENGQQVRLVNVPNIGSFPFLYKSLRVKGAELKDGKSLSFWNISVLKRADIRKRIGLEIKSLLKGLPSDEEAVLLLYNYRCMALLPKLKKAKPTLKVVMVVTDLPEFMLRPQKGFLGLGGKLLSSEKLHKDADFEFVDGFVLLAPAMKEKLPIGDKPWTLVEGIFNSDTQIEPQQKDTHKTILYSGNLGLRYGIGTLLEAFHQIPDNNYRLWICGGGDGLAEVQKYSAIDSRIIYKGIIPRNEVLKLQSRATVLVNPRNSDDDYTRYSFPSKTMEYLASGTPVVMSHLESIPEEYDAHIYYINNETTEGIKDKLMEVCDKPMSELQMFGDKASKFIYARKTPQQQTKIIINLISRL